MARRERESWWQWLKRKLTRRPRLLKKEMSMEEMSMPPQEEPQMMQEMESMEPPRRHHNLMPQDNENAYAYNEEDPEDNGNEMESISQGPTRRRNEPEDAASMEESISQEEEISAANKSEVRVLPSTSDEDYYDVNVSTEAHEESSVTHYSNPSFDCLSEKSVQVTNKEQHIVWEGYGLTLHISSNSLPVNCSSFELKIEVGMSGEFELPEDDGALVSAVYSFKHNLGDKELRQPITLGMQHCALPSALKHLSIIRASAGSKKIVVVPDGDFTTTSGYGEIRLLKFSNFAIMFLRRHFSKFFSPFEYCCQVYTTAITCPQFNFEVCIFRNLQVLSKVIEDQIKRREKQYESTGPPAEIQFQERIIRLEVPEGSYGDGWIMDCNTPEIDRNKVDRYTDRKVFIPCVVKVRWVGDGETGPTKFSYKIKFKGAVEGFNVIDVTSPRYVSKETVCKSKISPQLGPQDFIDFPEPELAILMEIVGVKVKTNWRDVGCALGLGNQLEEIYQSFKGETAMQDCIRRVFTKWYDGETCEYSWKKLAEVLCSATVNKQGLLPDIHAKLMTKYQ